MALEGITGGTGINLPSFGGIDLVPSLVIFFLAAIAVAVITYWKINKRVYNKKIHIFEEIDEVPVPVGDDLAREIVLPGTSLRAFYLKSRGLYLPRPSRQTGKGHYWFIIRKDGEWTNVKPKSLSKSLQELELDFDHTDMRGQNAALKKLVADNYKKIKWWKEYAPYIAIGILVLLLGVSSFINLKQQGTLTSQNSQVADTNERVVDRFDKILVTIEKICSTSGVVQVAT